DGRARAAGDLRTPRDAHVTQACDLISVELQLDRIEAELANELPPHMRTFARAYARGSSLPPAPEVLHRWATLATARAALAHPVPAARGPARLPLAVPPATERDAGAQAALAAQPPWEALAELAQARDAAASALFGHRAIDLLHCLYGSPVSDDPAPPLPP